MSAILERKSDADDGLMVLRAGPTEAGVLEQKVRRCRPRVHQADVWADLPVMRTAKVGPGFSQCCAATSLRGLGER